ncbi:sensor histidine kinase [Tessaracoccus caeni]|uniref:sensor histidine kinase n=1 Tax=Tessaracoccus caeni TaxID=3031239 RepID=UPI0023DB96A5|nr:HAMP domain-containing sensor histidine kinase [Tessaracoccus caeni]MDF1489278.1 HAMP domain-containing sensor histidine kinase [Tessaracoccus caeni]
MSRSRPGSQTLARRLQRQVTIAVATMAILLSFITVVTARSLMMFSLDQEVTSVSQQIPAGIRGASSPWEGLPPGAVVAVPTENGVVAALMRKGKVRDIPDEAITQLLETRVDRRAHTVELPEMGSYRVQARLEGQQIIVVGLPMSRIENDLRRIAMSAALISLLAIAVTSFVTRAMINSSTRPLKALSEAASEVSEMPLDQGEVNLHTRVDVSMLPPENEIARLGEAFNHMLNNVESGLAAREASEQKLRRFVADASHELRNPLAAIRGYSELAERSPEPLSTDTSFALGRISAESQRMTKLVGDLLLLARLDADAPVEPQPVDVVEVALNAVSDARAADHEHRWQLELPDAAISVLADPDQLHQVLVNLLSNARVHTPSGTMVTTSVSAENGQCVIQVRDDGPGIPADTLPRVFERFARADSSRAHSAAHSTGLGLAIVDAVVRSFGGTAEVASRPGDTVFTVRLPLHTP